MNLRCKRSMRSRSRGAAVIMAMLLAALAATIAATLLWQQQRWIGEHQHRRRVDQHEERQPDDRELYQRSQIHSFSSTTKVTTITK